MFPGSIQLAFFFDPDTEPPAEAELYRDFLSEGDLALWIGREKHRKTNLMQQLAISASVARDFLHFRSAAGRPLRVVYVDYESRQRKLWQRVSAMCDAMNLNERERPLMREDLRILVVREALKTGIVIPRFPIKVNSKEEHEAQLFWMDFAAQYPADLYIFDPMKCMHSQDVNDSNIEQFLSRIREVFRGRTVIVSHHMRRRGGSDGVQTANLAHDMRTWSDNARGSGALKAHADIIICQERSIEEDREIVRLGAFGKDLADVEPLPLEESDVQSFCWLVTADVPAHLRVPLDLFQKAGGKFDNKAEAAKVLTAAKVPKSTAYRNLKQLEGYGLLVEQEDSLVVRPFAEPSESTAARQQL